MRELENKIKAGSPVTEDDIALAILNRCLHTQSFYDFYTKGAYDAYVSGIASTPEEKKVELAKTIEGIKIHFAPLMNAGNQSFTEMNSRDFTTCASVIIAGHIHINHRTIMTGMIRDDRVNAFVTKCMITI